MNRILQEETGDEKNWFRWILYKKIKSAVQKSKDEICLGKHGKILTVRTVSPIALVLHRYLTALNRTVAVLSRCFTAAVFHLGATSLPHCLADSIIRCLGALLCSTSLLHCLVALLCSA
jgi:hypothetical protein